MELRRFALIATGTSVLATWFVTLAVNVSVGAVAPPSRFAAVGPLPATPPPLPPLVLPDHDPFQADVMVVKPATNRKSAGGGNIANVDVPGPGSFGMRNSLGIIGVIVGQTDSYAILEDGATVSQVRVGDAFAGTKIASINSHAVTLANGTVLDLDAPSPASIGNGSTPAASTSPPSPAPYLPRTEATPVQPEPRRVMVAPEATSALSSGMQVQIPGIGQPIVTGPTGALATPIPALPSLQAIPLPGSTQ